MNKRFIYYGLGLLWVSCLNCSLNAVPGIGQLPGHGQVANGVSVSYSMTGTNTATLTVSQPTAILWQSSGGSLNVPSSGPGFNVGAQAKFVISASNGLYNPVLNVDTTASPSMILGMVQAPATAPFILANGSGIIVGSSAVINSPAGVGLIGYNVPLSVAQSFTGFGLGIIPGLSGSFVTIQPGASITYGPTDIPPIIPGTPVGSALLVTAPVINLGIASASSLNGGPANHFLDILSGYQFLFSFRVLGDNNGFRISPTPILGSQGSIILSGPSSGFFTFPTGSFLLSSGNITTSGQLVLPGGGDIQWGLGYGNLGMWQGWLYNYGTITFSQALSPQTVGFHGSLSNWGTILGNPSATLPGVVIWVTGSIINNSGAIMNGGGTNVDLWAQQGALINKGTISSYDFVDLFAQNPGGLNSQFPLGSVYNSGVINITSPTASTDSFTNPGNLAISLFAPLYPQQLTAVPNINLWASSATGNVFFVTGGAVNTADPGGLHAAALSAASFPLSTFYLNIPITSQIVSFNGGNLTGGGVLTTEEFQLTTAGNVNNVVSTHAIQNGFQIANGPFANTIITINAIGVGPQIINLAVNGNATLDSGSTSTFMGISPAPSGLTGTAVNAEGNLLVNASGNLTVSGGTPKVALSTNILGFLSAFTFPGGVALQAGGSLTVNVPIDNGYTAMAGPNFQGIFLSAPVITVNAPFVTSGNTLVHTSVPISPVTVYDATLVSPAVYNLVPSPGKLVVSPFPFQ